jgi:ElaB/YqjD/DUF883 family membrane-anchored ribosome-binding protein
MADTNTAETPKIDAAIESGSSALDSALEASKSFLGKAQEAISDAFDSTVEAVKENPLTAVGIAAGAAAAVAGAAFGVSKLLEEDAPAPKGKAAAKK